jgi:hypothetical protein
MARFAFLDPSATGFYPDWSNAADTSVALLHTEASRDPLRPGPDRPGRRVVHPQRGVPHRWAAHDVRLHRTGVKHFQHPAVGRLDLTFDAMEIPTDPGLTMTRYTAEPGTRSEENLKLLASWAAAVDQAAAARDGTSEHHLA